MSVPRRGAAKADRVTSTTTRLTRSRANLRRLRAAHAEIESEIARRRPPAAGAPLPVERYTRTRVREFDRAEAALARALREPARSAQAARDFLKNADRLAAAGVPALSEDEIQAESDAPRRARRRPRRAARGR
jgi:hypothetical protein